VTVLDVSLSRGLALIEYPTPSGVRKTYVKNIPSILRYFAYNNWQNGSTEELVLDENGNKIGSLNPYEKATILFKAGDLTHVVYNVNGEWDKSGFVKFGGIQ